MKQIAIFCISCVIIAVSLFIYQTFQTQDQCSTGHMSSLQTPKQTLSISIAQTPQEQAKGLGGCAQLGENRGMYFPFSSSGPQIFWMKNMRIPIDIIWISGGKVVGITSHAPFPSPGANDESLPLYHSPQDVDAVLEVGAGMSDSYGLTDGSSVVLGK